MGPALDCWPLHLMSSHLVLPNFELAVRGNSQGNFPGVMWPVRDKGAIHNAPGKTRFLDTHSKR